jgi:hypothetical protein
MSDASVAALLRSDRPLVLIEASAGCGKTFQGAAYARDVAGTIGRGRLLILTHTHAACGVFAERTRDAGTKVEIRTIDALIGQIATAYHKPLQLPASLASWAWQDNGKGFEIMAGKVATLLMHQPMIAQALARRYPVVICDEHQDSSGDQHTVVMAMHRGGSLLRVFGDPMQRIYGMQSDKEARADGERWEALQREAVCEKLSHPHRWDDGCPALGKWILEARTCLENGQPINLAGDRPPSLQVIVADNVASHRGIYQLSRDHRRPIDQLVDSAKQLMILASQNDLVTGLSAFWGRRIPIWEGHTRDALATLVTVLREKAGDAEALAAGMVAFVGDVAAGFNRTSHGNRLIQEVRAGCVRQTTGKPANIQAIAQRIVDDPSHMGVATALDLLRSLIDNKAAGFDTIKIDRRVEFKDATRLGQFDSPDEGFAEIARKRAYIRPAPPARVLSNIHKAKGLECDNVLVMGCERTQFSTTSYARCRMYVALSRAKKSLTFVVPSTNLSPLLKVA